MERHPSWAPTTTGFLIPISFEISNTRVICRSVDATNHDGISFPAAAINARLNGSFDGRAPGVPALKALSSRASYCASINDWRMNATAPMPVDGYAPPRFAPNETSCATPVRSPNRASLRVPVRAAPTRPGKSPPLKTRPTVVTPPARSALSSSGVGANMSAASADASSSGATTGGGGGPPPRAPAGLAG